MKKLVSVIVAVLFTAGVYAQAEKSATKSNTTTEQTKTTMHNDMHHDMKDCVMMKDGKMWMMKGGKTMPMTSEMKMSNGNTVTTNGEVMMADGNKMMMKNGDCMDMHGMMMPSNMGKTKTSKATTTDNKKEATTKEQ